MSFILTCCNNGHDKKENTSLPPEMRKEMRAALRADSFYHIEITGGKLVAEALSQEKQSSKIVVWDLRSGKNYGDFPWPDSPGGRYFGIAPYDDHLLYFNNHRYFRKISLLTKKVDTIPLQTAISELINMIVISNKAYSLGNIYGIDIVDIDNTSRQVSRRNYKGHYYNEQNNLSLPVNDSLNLVASCEVDSGQYALYAIDSTMTIRWTKMLHLKDRLVQIRSLHLPGKLLLKFDNTIQLVAEKDGKTIWERTFDANIFNMFKVSDSEVILFFSKYSNGGNILPSEWAGGFHYKKIIKLNLDTRMPAWEIDSIGSYGEKSLLTNNYLFDMADSGHWAKIDLQSGRYTKFAFDPGRVRLDVIRDKRSGTGYLFYGDSLYLPQ
jgi:hypothetical protein